MFKIQAAIVFIILSVVIVQAQGVVPIPEDRIERTPLSFRDYRIRRTSEVYKLESIKSDDLSRDLTGYFSYQDSNNRSIDMQLENNLAVGDWVYYGSNFTGSYVSAEVSFKEGLKHGTEIIYGSYRVEGEERFKQNVSYWKQYDMGVMKIEVSYWDNGQLAHWKHYNTKGHILGNYITYHKNGEVHTKSKYRYSIGTLEYFDEKGDRYLRRKHNPNKKKLKEKLFYSDGQLKSIKNKKDGVFHKRNILLDRDGKKLNSFYYKKGIKKGKQKRFNFHPPYHENYRVNNKGIIQGKYTQIFLDTAHYRVKGKYNKKGERVGKWEYYLEDTRLYRTEIYKMNYMLKAKTHIKNLNDIPIESQSHLGSFPDTTYRVEKSEPKLFLFSQ